MGSHSVTCHLAVVRIPPLPPDKAGTRFSDPKGMQGWVDLCYIKADRPGIEPATRKSQVQSPTTKGSSPRSALRRSALQPVTSKNDPTVIYHVAVMVSRVLRVRVSVSSSIQYLLSLLDRADFRADLHYHITIDICWLKHWLFISTGDRTDRRPVTAPVSGHARVRQLVASCLWLCDELVIMTSWLAA